MAFRAVWRRRLGEMLAGVLLLAGPLVVSSPARAALVEQTLFQRDTFGAACYRIPALIRTKAGSLLAFAEKRISGTTWCNDVGHIDLVMRRSTDNGRTWSAQRVVLEGTDGSPTTPATRGNPAPVVYRKLAGAPDTGAPDGRIVLLTTYNPSTTSRPRTPYVQYSDDDGSTWSTARSIAAQIDKPEWGWYATGPSHAIQLTRGAHAGRLVAGVNFTDGSGRHGAALVHSDNGGADWQLGATDIRSDDLDPQELSLVERTDGGIYAAARTNSQVNGTHRAWAVSRDGGETFAAPFASTPGVTAPGVQGSTLRLRAADEGDRYNRILFASPADPTYRRYLTIWSSYDEGRTWSTAPAKQITADRSGYSDLAELPSGEIGLLYEAGESTGDARDEIRFTRLVESDLGLPDDYSGIRTPDLSGLNNDGRLRGGTTYGAGRFDEAATLDGVDDAVQVPFAESLAIDNSDFTATAWIRYGASTGNHAILWAYHQGDHSQLWLRAEPESNRIRGFIQSGSVSAVVASARAYNDNAWHHVALQRAGGQLKLWVDGTVAATATAPTGSISPGRPFTMYVGQRLDGAHHFHGQLDEVRLYRRALSGAEIDAIRTSNATSASGAVLRLPFTADGLTTADLSGNGNTGLLRGGPTLATGRFGNALAFDGTDDHVHLPFTGTLDLGAGDFTITMWLRHPGGPGRHSLLWAYDHGADSGQLWLRAQPADNQIVAWAQSDVAAGWTSTTPAYGDDAWHHLALQRTGGELLLWVDGVRVAAGAAPAGSLTAGHGGGIKGLYLGRRPDGADDLNGALDEVRVFRRALTPTELDDVRLQNTAATIGQVLWLPFERITAAG
ncbi:LamG-like jellyroll fold domain-containing protein [Micromonospora sp. NPDC047670]|uniref:LamG-like jellyroll fold domain-containing protein n=1 Tax=Micromonospora sp. NPDC047670 TaxID=3364252 RepID=UPI003721D207